MPARTRKNGRIATGGMDHEDSPADRLAAQGIRSLAIPRSQARCATGAETTSKRDEPMRTRLLAVAPCLRRARAPERVCFEEKRKTVLRPLVAFLTLLFLAPLLIGEAEAICERSYRISHSDSACLGAWWDNSPSAYCWGTKGGAKNFCSEYGNIRIKVDLIRETDYNTYLPNSKKWRYENCVTDTREISCCVDKSDLCLKQQVEAFDGIIKQWTGSGTNFRDIDVSTHRKRYEFCQDNSDNIYCSNDPAGDAFDRPEPVEVVEVVEFVDCNAATCTVEHCSTAFKQSVGSRCTLHVTGFANGSGMGGMCEVDVTCTDSSGVAGPRGWFTATLLEIRDDLEVCDDGSLTVSGC